MNVSYLQLSILQYLNHMKMIDLPQVLVDRTQHPPFSHPTPLFSSIYTYQSTDAIRKRHLYIHISRLMQSENGILLLFYIFLSHGNGKKKKKKMKKRGDAVCPVHKYLWDLHAIINLYWSQHYYFLVLMPFNILYNNAVFLF